MVWFESEVLARFHLESSKYDPMHICWAKCNFDIHTKKLRIVKGCNICILNLALNGIKKDVFWCKRPFYVLQIWRHITINTYFCSYECRYLNIYARLQLTSSVFNLSFSYPNIDLEDARYVLHLSGKNMFLHTFRVIEVLKKQLHSSYSTHDVVKCLLKKINWNLTFFLNE